MVGGDVGGAVPGGDIFCGTRAGGVWGLQSLVTALVVLAAVPGVGEKKLETYGEAVLEVVADEG